LPNFSPNPIPDLNPNLTPNPNLDLNPKPLPYPALEFGELKFGKLKFGEMEGHCSKTDHKQRASGDGSAILLPGTNCIVMPLNASTKYL